MAREAGANGPGGASAEHDRGGEAGDRAAVTDHQVAADGTNWFQRRRRGIDAGDVFSLPLPSGGYGFGRVMNVHDGADIAEFFRYRSFESTYSDDILRAGRLFSPIGIMITAIAWRNRERPWRVVRKDPVYYPDDLYEIPFLSASGTGGGLEYYTLNDIRKVLGSVSPEEEKNGTVCSIMPQNPGWIARTVEERLPPQIRRL